MTKHRTALRTYWQLYERARRMGYTAADLSGKTTGELQRLVDNRTPGGTQHVRTRRDP